MKTTAVKFATAGAFAALVATSAFAAPQQGDGTRYGRNRDTQQRQQQQQQQTSRDNQRYSASGRITSLSRERAGYRVQLDRGRESYYVPQSRLGGRGLRVGISIGLGGIFRGDRVDVDAVNWNGGYGYDSGYLRGVVQRVDYRDGFATLRDDAGRMVSVRLGGNTRQLRRGDFVTLEGQWDRGNVFEAYRIDDVR